ncbi:UbiA family prenyltransferase [Prochlorococcus sp. AH-736-A21]|nr:UbiA family prenyltransferase [Prochlorococcus sp. AH-736-A21]
MTSKKHSLIKKKLPALIKICRPEYFVKQIFCVAGIIIAFLLAPKNIFNLSIVFLAFIAAVLSSSANYVINEWCDRITDSFHPRKKFRPIPSGLLNKLEVSILYIFLCIFPLFISIFLIKSKIISLMIILILTNGILYNKKPIRLKDKVFLDVFSESINNPLRFSIGWLSSSYAYPPISLIIGIWLIGYFLMNCKRICEIRDWNSSEGEIGDYRISLTKYTLNNLVLVSFISALSAITSITIFLTIYRIELCLITPFIILSMAQYLRIALSSNSKVIINNPSYILKDKLIFFSLLIVLILGPLVLVVDIPLLQNILSSGMLYQ